MKQIIKDLWLAIALIVLASFILLLSDKGQRRRAGITNEYPSIAIMQISTTPLLDTHVAGILNRLEESAYVAPDRRNIHLFNPLGDFAMANTLAREIVNGPFDIVITSSTVALQVFSKANQSVQKLHVFGGVTDPYGAGVGITGPEPDQHPPYMAGIGTFQPVERAFRILKEFNPRIKRVGVVWNPGEQCSEACMKIAREICKELDIELMEAIATNTSEVSEAARSLMAKDVEAIWIGGDTVASASIGLITGLAHQSGIPVFTNDPMDYKSGALFGLGGNYFTIGQYTADMAVAILEGASPTSFRIENVVPELFRLNHDVLESLDNRWALNDHIRALLAEEDTQEELESLTIDFALMKQSGKKPDQQQLITARRFLNLSMLRDRPARIVMINLVENMVLEEAERGVEAGLQQAGLKKGIDYEIKKFSAQGEIGQLPQIVEAAINEQPDLIVTVTTPVLMAIANKKLSIPVVFTVASDPYKLNLFQDGRPENICGVHDNPPVDELLEQGAKGAIGDQPYDWGKLSGVMAARVLAGLSPAMLPFEETKVQQRIDPGNKTADIHPGRLLELRIVHYSDTEFAERCHEGLVDGIRIAGYNEGRDYNLRTYNAQGDMSTLSSIMNNIKSDRVDLLMVISTPALQAALRQAGTHTKIVFTGVGDAVKAGAGTSETDHLPNVTGITTRSPFNGMARLIRETLPGTRNVGTLFTPAEINSVLYKDWFAEALANEGISLTAIPVTSSADISQSAGDLCARNIDVLCQVVDNLTRPGFALIARKASEKNIPVFVFDSSQMKDGGVVCLSRDYYDAGLEAAEKAIRIMKGENPAMIPFHNTTSEKLIINYALATKHRLQISSGLRERSIPFNPQQNP